MTGAQQVNFRVMFVSEDYSIDLAKMQHGAYVPSATWEDIAADIAQDFAKANWRRWLSPACPYCEKVVVKIYGQDKCAIFHVMVIGEYKLQITDYSVLKVD
jgi:hypothetical protein